MPSDANQCLHCGYGSREEEASFPPVKQRTPGKRMIAFGVVTVVLVVAIAGSAIIWRLRKDGSRIKGGSSTTSTSPNRSDIEHSLSNDDVRLPVPISKNPPIEQRALSHVRIHEFAVKPSEIKVGQSVLITWKVSDATAVSIAGLGIVPVSGAREYVPPRETTEVVLQAQGVGPNNYATARFPVRILLPPNVSDFGGAPEPTTPDQPLTLHWSVNGATLISIDYPGLESLPAEGETRIHPTQTTEYILRAEGPGGVTTSKFTGHVCETWKIDLMTPQPSRAFVASDCRMRNFTSTSDDSYAHRYQFALSQPGKIYAVVSSQAFHPQLVMFGLDGAQVGKSGGDLYVDVQAKTYALLVESPGNNTGAYNLRIEFHDRNEDLLPVGEMREGTFMPGEGRKHYRLWVPRKAVISLKLEDKSRFVLWIQQPGTNRLSAAGTQTLNPGVYDLYVIAYRGQSGTYTLSTREQQPSLRPR